MKKADFRKQLEQNKIKSNEKARQYKNNTIVDVEVGDYMIKVDRTGYYIGEKEVKDVITDLFYVGSKIEPKKKLSLSSVCDVCFDLICDKINGNEIMMRIC